MTLEVSAPIRPDEVRRLLLRDFHAAERHGAGSPSRARHPAKQEQIVGKTSNTPRNLPTAPRSETSISSIGSAIGRHSRWRAFSRA